MSDFDTIRAVMRMVFEENIILLRVNGIRLRRYVWRQKGFRSRNLMQVRHISPNRLRLLFLNVFILCQKPIFKNKLTYILLRVYSKLKGQIYGLEGILILTKDNMR